MSTAYENEHLGAEVEPFVLAISSITSTMGIRSGGFDEAHVSLLQKFEQAWPPVVVWGLGNVLVDGVHRVEAARRLHRRNVVAVRLQGTENEAHHEAIKRNAEHGLPLASNDRRRAADKVLHGFPEWSDRRIAALCGISDKTVGSMRRLMGSDAATLNVPFRIGIDGRTRPVDTSATRQRIIEAIDEDPTGSLRAIAGVVGVSHETVRNVKARLASKSAKGPGAGGDEYATLSDAPSPLRDWSKDAALAATSDSGDFVQWFNATDIDREWRRHAPTVPVSRIYEVADEARRRAETWNRFATVLEQRVHRNPL